MGITIPDEAYSSIGRVITSTQGLVTAEHIRRFVVAIDDHNPIFHDKTAAQALGYVDIVAPPLFCSAATRPIPWRSEILADGQFDNIAPPGLTHLQTILAGQRWEIMRPVVAGELVAETCTIKSITPREGKNGLVILVEKQSTLTVMDKVVERQVLTIALREPSSMPQPTARVASLVDRLNRAHTEIFDGGFIKNPDMISVFMFAAAIWAVHRLHYDVLYAQFEGLPGPIVPGWMLASYLAELAGRLAGPGKRLRTLDVRYRATASPGDVLTCRATDPITDSSSNLIMVKQDGQTLVTAEANCENNVT